MSAAEPIRLLRPRNAVTDAIAAYEAMSDAERDADDHARYVAADRRYAREITPSMIRRANGVPRTGRGER